MSLTTSDNKVTFVGNGSTTNFAFSFKTYDAPDIEVYLINQTTGAEELQTVSTHYTIALNPTFVGGTITFLTPPANLQKGLIRRQTSKVQETIYNPVTPFPAELTERQFDKIVMMVQDLQEEINRSITSAVSGVEGVIMPSPDASKFLGWNSAGTQLENKDVLGQGNASIPALTSNKEKVLSVNAGETALEFFNNTLRNAEYRIETGTSYSVVASDKGKVVVANNASPVTFNLPALTANQVYMLGNIGAGALTLNPNGSDTIQDNTVAQDQMIILVSDITNTKWRTLSISAGASSGSGAIVQEVKSETSSVFSSSNLFPVGVPQNTDGIEILTRTITPTNASNILKIEANIVAGFERLGANAFYNFRFGLAFFKDSDAAALYATGWQRVQETSGSSEYKNGTMPLTFRHYFVAGTTSPIDFKLRGGIMDDASNIFVVNEFENGQNFGGTMVSSLSVTEIKA